MKGDAPSREELFALVWERPATQVALDLGISDVALGKLCRKLQVPKPPRGYWARVESGQTPRKPALRAFREESKQNTSRQRRRRTKGERHGPVKLSKKQREFLMRTLQELRDAGTDISGIDLAYDGIRSLESGLAANMVILIQNRYEKWLEQKSTTTRNRSGSHQSVRGLVSKLLPLAKEQVAIFRPVDNGDYGPIIILRLSLPLQQIIASQCQLVRANGLAYVASGVGAVDHAWSVRYAYSPSSYANVTSELCVSANEIWLRCEMQSHWDSRTHQFETKHQPIQQLIPSDLIPEKEIKLPASVKPKMLRPYAKRLRALKGSETILDSLTNAAYEIEREVPNEHLALIDRLWFGEGDNGPFISARRAWRKLEEDLERWEESVEAEKSQLCKEILGVDLGDIVLVESGNKVIRVQLDDASVFMHETDVVFHITGTKYRKDGTLGKRQETFYIHVEDGQL